MKYLLSRLFKKKTTEYDWQGNKKKYKKFTKNSLVRRILYLEQRCQESKVYFKR